MTGSIAIASGIVSVNPSAACQITVLAPGLGWASARMSLARMPFHMALPIRSPPTSLLMHSNVWYRSTGGAAFLNSSSVSLSGFSTNPVTSRVHFATFTVGSKKFLET